MGVLLVTIGLFWSVSNYSAGVGIRSALEVEARLPDLLNTILHSAAARVHRRGRPTRRFVLNHPPV